MDRINQIIQAATESFGERYQDTAHLYRCQMCLDTGMKVIIEGNREMAIPCECQRQKAIDRMITRSGLTNELRKKNFTGYAASKETAEMRETAWKYVKDFDQIRNECPNGMALTGTVGVGKTHLLAAIANNLLAKKIPVLYVNTPDFMAELLASQFSQDRSELDKKITMAASVAVAIFDDLAKEKVSEWGQTQYYRIINARYQDNLPTLFSSNCDWDQLGDKLGDAVMSRLYAMTRGRVAHVVAKDYRMGDK